MSITVVGQPGKKDAEKSEAEIQDSDQEDARFWFYVRIRAQPHQASQDHEEASYYVQNVSSSESHHQEEASSLSSRPLLAKDK